MSFNTSRFAAFQSMLNKLNENDLNVGEIVREFENGSSNTGGLSDDCVLHVDEEPVSNPFAEGVKSSSNLFTGVANSTGGSVDLNKAGAIESENLEDPRLIERMGDARKKYEIPEIDKSNMVKIAFNLNKNIELLQDKFNQLASLCYHEKHPIANEDEMCGLIREIRRESILLHRQISC